MASQNPQNLQHIQLTKRELRENELQALLGSPAGRNQLTQLLRGCLNIPSGQIPLGTPFVKTILDQEFANQESPPA